MQKKIVFLIGVIIALVCIIAYVKVPWVQAGTDNFIGNVAGPAWTNFTAGVTTAIGASPIWKGYGGWITLGIGAVLGGAVLLLLQKGKSDWKFWRYKRKQPIEKSLDIQREPAVPEASPVKTTSQSEETKVETAKTEGGATSE